MTSSAVSELSSNDAGGLLPTAKHHQMMPPSPELALKRRHRRRQCLFVHLNVRQRRRRKTIYVPRPDEPVDQSSTGWSLGQHGQHLLTLQFCAKFHFLILSLPFLDGFPNFFMSNAEGILIFGKKIDHFLSVSLYDVLYDAYDMEIYVIRRNNHQVFISKH